MIAIVTPTRHRPQAITDMLGAIISTVDDPRKITVYVGIDDDDCSYKNVEMDSFVIKRVVGPRQQLAGWTNELAEMAIKDGATIIGSLGDDHRPRTQGWDTRIREAMDAQSGGLVYTRDGLQDQRLPTAPFWSFDVIKTLGWYFPTQLKHMFADNWWIKFASDIGRCAYLPDVLIEHLHPSANKAQADEVNAENDSFYHEDERAFTAFVSSQEYQDCVARVREVLG